MKFEHTEVFNFEGAFRGLRNPLESWDKSDSGDCRLCGSQCSIPCKYPFKLGKNDLDLAQRMLKAGSDNSKFMREIMVSVDITAPLYWWKEWDTYKVGTVANSTSTMHKLAITPITMDCFETGDYDENLNIGDDAENIQDRISYFTEDIIITLENIRKKYLQTKDKRFWKELIRWLPEAWLQKRTCTLDYANLRAMYFARRNHKLSCWSVDFINWMNELPYAKELIEHE